MKVLTFSRTFPKGHPKAGQPTYFVEKVWNGFRADDFSMPPSILPFAENYVKLLPGKEYLKAMEVREIKHHTIRAGNRWKVGDMASLRVWSGATYRSKQIEFAQAEVKKVWPFEIHIVGDDVLWKIPGFGSGAFDILSGGLKIISRNDGLEIRDFLDWFVIHPKTEDKAFAGQIISWSDKIDYQ